MPAPVGEPVRFHESVRSLLVPIDQVHPSENNPRRGNVALIVESMRANGVYQPIVAQPGTGAILAGNHRYAALVELGAEQVPVVWADTASDADGVRIALADNRTSDLATYDDAALLQLLRELGDEDDALVGTGYVEADRQLLERYLERADVEPFDEHELADILSGKVNLTITDLDNADVTAFRAIDAPDDATRLRALLAAWMPDSAELDA